MEKHNFSQKEAEAQLQGIKELPSEEQERLREKVLRDGAEFLKRMRQLTEQEQALLLAEGKNPPVNWAELSPEKKEVLEPILNKLFGSQE